MIEYRKLQKEEITRPLFDSFVRRQVVDLCWRRENGAWVLRSDPFVDDWSEEDYAFLVRCLQNTLRCGGLVLGAFVAGKLKGFASVEGSFFGGENRYLDLTSIHVSEDLRRGGIGRSLFLEAAAWAKEQGARKLYISAHSAVESQAFYRALGCVEAAEVNPAHVEAEPFDCQLEYLL